MPTLARKCVSAFGRPGDGCALSGGCDESTGKWESSQDFSDPEQDYFPTESTASTTVRVEGGRYIVVEKPLGTSQILGAPLHASIEHLDIEADALKPTGGADWIYGIGCWTKWNGSGYVFAVSETEGYAILKTTPEAFGVGTGTPLPPLGTKRTTDPASKDELKIRGTCEGGGGGTGGHELRMYVDDELAVEADDPSGFEDFSAAGFLVVARQQTTEFSFDNFVARER